MTLRIGMVSGLYSPWSPEVKTNKVKVLTNLEDHKVILPENPKFLPPVLGRVGESELILTTRREFEKLISPIDKLENIEDESTPKSLQDRSPILQHATYELAMKSEERLKYLSYAAWAIVVLLAIIMFR